MLFLSIDLTNDKLFGKCMDDFMIDKQLTLGLHDRGHRNKLLNK